jgi:polynucleotide 5'-hydroxyl-kinase GRC3/NOL9
VRDLIDAWKLDIMFANVTGIDDEDEGASTIIPLIINTMGWSKGLGANLTERIEEMAEPAWIFDFNINDDFFYSDVSEPWTQRYTWEAQNTYTLEPAPLSILSTNYSAADNRNLSILSYFYSIFPSTPKSPAHGASLDQITAQSWNTTLPLCATLPYEIDIYAAIDQIILRGAGSEDVVPEEIGRVLNGAVVGFVRPDHLHNHMESFDVRDDRPRVPYTQGQPPPAPSESSCIGLGLIRAVSFPSLSQSSASVPPALLQILTPIPPALLTGARILVKGEMELPVWGMLDFRDPEGGVAGTEKSRVPYLQWGRGSEGAIGAEKRRVRRNLMRKGQT